MTTEIAYQILGLENNASTEEVKEAYAKLSKEYHPEENPEEFQRIHEAYTTLTRRGRRGNRAMVVESSPIEKNSAPEQKESDLVFQGIHNAQEENREIEQTPELSFERSVRSAKKQQVESAEQDDEQESLNFGASIRQARNQEQEEENSYNFDASIQQAQRQEEEQFQQNIQICIDELVILFSPENYNNLKRFKEFFGRKEYEKVFYSRPFIYYLAQYINQVELKYEVYSYLIKFYQLKGRKVEELIPEAQQLYRVIDSRYSITHDVIAARRNGFFGGAFGGILYAIVKFGPKIFRNINNQGINLNELNFLVFVPFIVIGLDGYILYKLFCKKHNIYEAMKKTAGWLFVLSIPVYVFDLWAPFSQNNPSNSASLAMCTIIVSAMWWLTMKLVIFILKTKRKQNEQK